MFETLGSLTASPWIYALVAVSIVLDVFLPVLPSGVLVITAAAAAAAAGATGPVSVSVSVSVPVPEQVPDILLLLVIATTASVLGDMAAYRLGRRGGARLDRAIARSRRLTRAHERLGTALARGGGALVVVARFAPAGRSVVSLGAGKTQRKVAEFLPWSVLAGMAWAGYSVALGYFGTQWLGTQWLGTALSVVALFAAGALAAFLVRRPEAAAATA
ncbi:VTT domain-containing protein [Streptomyces sp. NBC_00853]|uniref:DedA family protein n=1 Tax=Streptomyces sp. NBC_00853 TaxID=2903681 RepID=UPI003872D16C|nr:VTT domain-containing protein [Streptomyces sp. NBC_00853]